MTLKTDLATAVAEKDVEGAYRSEITRQRPSVVVSSPHGIDGYTCWKNVRALLEFKYDLALKERGDQISVLAQLIKYLKKFETAGEELPNVLFVGDKNECFALQTATVQHFLSMPVNWLVAPSTFSPDLTKLLQDGYQASPWIWDIADSDFREILTQIEELASGEIKAVRATEGTLYSMFTYWINHVFPSSTPLSAVEQVDVFLHCLFYPADTFMHPKKENVLIANGREVSVHKHKADAFFARFVQGYTAEEIETFYARRDRLLDDEVRRRQGAFYTPTPWVNEAHKMVTEVLGPNWRQECIVWDPAAGTGNLTRDYRFSNLIISTAEPTDIAVIREQGYNQGASIFAYDFLNGETTPFFSGLNAIPAAVDRQLKAAAKEGKRLVWFMNPPYAEDGVMGSIADSKAGVAKTGVGTELTRLKMGRAGRQLYAQFLCQADMLTEKYGFRNYTVAAFTKPTFLCSGSYRKFREFWYSGFAYKAGMLFKASHFDDVSASWGVCFTIWNNGQTDLTQDLPMLVKDDYGFGVADVWQKAFYNSNGRDASSWVLKGPAGKGDSPKFSSGLSVRDGYAAGQCSGSLGVFCNMGNNLVDSATGVMLLSGKPTHKGRCHVDLLPGESFRRATALYAARKLVTGYWINDKDEYLHPADTTPAYKQWNDDAIVYALLHNSNNCTAMRDVEYKGKKWRIKNHFWWKTLAESKVLYNTAGLGLLYADLRNEDQDAYLSTVLSTLILSQEAQDCLAILDNLLIATLPARQVYAQQYPELHLLCHDAGVYQLKHLFREVAPDGWKALQTVFKALADKMRPGVYTHGFLKE